MAHRLVLVPLLLLLTLGPCGAELLRFRVHPNGAMAQVGEQTVAPDKRVFEIDLPADVEHTVKITRTHFMPLTLTLKWDPSAGLWYWQEASRQLLDQETLYLSKSVKFNVDPPDVEAWLATTEGPEIVISGATYRKRPFQRNPDGSFVVLNAGNSRTVILERPLFDPHILVFKDGDLDRPETLLPTTPVRMRPTYGPFSYPWFNIGFAVVVVGGGTTWFMLSRKKRQHQRMMEMETSMVPRQPAVNIIDPSTLNVRIPQPAEGMTLVTEQLHEFVLLEEIGKGGMGAVYKAAPVYDLSLLVAIKILTRGEFDDVESRKRFMQEIEICSRLTHPGIVKVMDWGMYGGAKDGWPFMVMEYVDGKDLYQILREMGNETPPLPTLVHWLIQVLRALKAAHSAGVVHRDMKPPNIMITRNNNAKVMDFGVARQLDLTTMTKTGMVVGTPTYMAPEQCVGRRPEPASDIFALGLIVFRTLTGRIPFEHDDPLVIMHCITSIDVPSLSEYRPDIPIDLVEVIRKMLARRLEHRYRSADDVLRDLIPIQETLGPPKTLTIFRP